MLIKITSQFEKEYKKLPFIIKQKAKEKEEVFRQNPFTSHLKNP